MLANKWQPHFGLFPIFLCSLLNETACHNNSPLLSNFFCVCPMSINAGSVIKQASLEGSIQMDTPPRSPPEPLADEEILDMVKPGPIPTQLKERPDMTAKQRWHWAYNKIIMQLNVSKQQTNIFHFLTVFFKCLHQTKERKVTKKYEHAYFEQ